MQKKNYIAISIVAAILLVATIVGSIWDLEIANATYLGQTPTENLFGVVFSFIGIIPTFVGWSFLGASIFYLSKKQVENAKKRRWLTAFSVLLFVLSFFYFCNTLYLVNANAFKVHFIVAYSIGIVVICIAAYLGYALSKKSENPELLSKVLFLAVVSLVVLLVVSVTKSIACRPRFRFVLAMEDENYFRSWWQSGKSIKDSLAAGIETDEFASFPSGHSAYSMFAIFLFPAFADYDERLKKYKPGFFALGFVWWAATALSRMTVGAHYLTDVTLAGLVTILAYVVVLVLKEKFVKMNRGDKVKTTFL